MRNWDNYTEVKNILGWCCGSRYCKFFSEYYHHRHRYPTIPDFVDHLNLKIFCGFDKNYQVSLSHYTVICFKRQMSTMWRDRVSHAKINLNRRSHFRYNDQYRHADFDLVEDQDSSSYLNQVVRDSLKTLSPRDRLLLMKRWGLNGAIPQSNSKIAKQLNLSRERVRQLLRRAEDRLRKVIKAKYPGSEYA